MSCVLAIALQACAEPHEKRFLIPPDERDAETASSELPDSGSADSGQAQAQICVLNEAYVEARKACNSDADCSSVEYQTTCCEEQWTAGIASEYLETALTCVKPRCGCEPLMTRAEDGRALVEGNAVATVQCVEQRCTTRITERQCGSQRLCGPNEICVTYENVPGGLPPDPDSGDNAYLTFRCEPNPCPERLDCTCAQALCDARNDVPRSCEIRTNQESDLTCRRFVD